MNLFVLNKFTFNISVITNPAAPAVEAPLWREGYVSFKYVSISGLNVPITIWSLYSGYLFNALANLSQASYSLSPEFLISTMNNKSLFVS